MTTSEIPSAEDAGAVPALNPTATQQAAWRDTINSLMASLSNAGVNPNQGALVYINPGLYLGNELDNLDIPADVVVMDLNNTQHAGFHFGGSDAEFVISGPNGPHAASSSPAFRLHSRGDDGLRKPIILFSKGKLGAPKYLWSIEGSADSNWGAGVEDNSMIFYGGQGRSYNTGTVNVTVGSRTVTGVGTSWTADNVGAVLQAHGAAPSTTYQPFSEVVESVESPTSLTLVSAWGTHGTGTPQSVAGAGYLLFGGEWQGCANTAHIFGQNGVVALNADGGPSGSGRPLDLGNSRGPIPSPLTYYFCGGIMENGAYNQSTLMALDNGLGGAGEVGLQLSATGQGAIPKSLSLDKATGSLVFKNGFSGATLAQLLSNGRLNLGYSAALEQLTVGGSGAFAGYVYPIPDNSYYCGLAGNRWASVFCSTGVVSTSDARLKTEVHSMSAAEIAAASDLAKAVGTYKWLASVKEKGSAARNHVGLTVQHAIEIMRAHGLDPMAYGFICFDEWGPSESHPEGGNAYSFRQDELALFMVRGQEARLCEIERRLPAHDGH